MFPVRSALVVASILLVASPASGCAPLPPQGYAVGWKTDTAQTTINLKWWPSLLAEEVGVEGYNVHHFLEDELLDPIFVPADADASDGHLEVNISGVDSGVHVIFVTAVAGALESAPGNVVVIADGFLVCTPIWPTINPRDIIFNPDCLDA